MLVQHEEHFGLQRKMGVGVRRKTFEEKRSKS